MPTKVVYVHGMGGSPEDWRPVQARQPGLSLALDAGSATPLECAEALADEIASLVSGSFAICGYSMGGRIALLATQALLAKKKKPDGLILISSGFGFSKEGEADERNRADEEWAKLASTNTAEFWAKWYAQELFSSFQALPEATRESWLEQRKTLEPADLASQLRHLGPGHHGDLMTSLKEVTSKGVRVLYLAGSLDKKYAAVAATLSGYPGVQTDLVQGAGHTMPLEAPEALAVRIAKFIR